MAKSQVQFKKQDNWATPIEVIKFFGPFDYDAATTDELARRFGVPNYDTIETDGLKRDWTHFNRIWVNPPFSRKFEFLEKAVESVSNVEGVKIFFLIPLDSLGTKRFHEVMRDTGYTLWLPNKRIAFEDGSTKSSPAFASVILEIDGMSRKRNIRHWNFGGENA